MSKNKYKGSLHTGEVVGSIPTAPTTKRPYLGNIFNSLFERWRYFVTGHNGTERKPAFRNGAEPVKFVRESFFVP